MELNKLLTNFDIIRIAREISNQMTEIESPLALLTAKDISKRYVKLTATLMKELWDFGYIPFYTNKGIRVSFKKDIDEYLLQLEVAGYHDNIFSKSNKTVINDDDPDFCSEMFQTGLKNANKAWYK